MNRGEIVTEVCAILGIDAVDIQVRVRTWLNLTLKRVGRRHFWDDLKQNSTTNTTTASVKEYDIVTDWSLTNLRHIHAINVIDGTNSRKLHYLPQRRLDQRRPYPDAFSTYKPTHYARWANKIWLIPLPDDSYTLHIRWSKWADDLTLDTSVCNISHIDDLLIAGTVVWGYMCIEDEDSALKWAKVAERTFQDAIMVERQDPDYEPIAVGHLTGADYNIEYWKSPFIEAVDVGGE